MATVKTQPVALITTFDSDFITENTGKAVCLPHEVYIDVACSFYKHREIGRRLIGYFMEYFKKRRVCAVRMHATDKARPLWIQKWGFREAETRWNAQKRVCEYGPVVRATHGPNEQVPTYRLTRVL